MCWFSMTVGLRAIIDDFYRLFRGTRPFDWLMFAIDSSVLIVSALVLIFSCPTWLRQHKAKKMVRAVGSNLERGRKLQSSVPDMGPHKVSEDLKRWGSDVEVWGEQTEVLLASHSRTASTAFTHVINAEVADRTVRRGNSTFQARGPYGDVYQILQIKLDNLQKIMENPEAYI